MELARSGTTVLAMLGDMHTATRAILAPCGGAVKGHRHPVATIVAAKDTASRRLILVLLI